MEGNWGRFVEELTFERGIKGKEEVLRTAMPNAVLGALLALTDMQCSQQACEKEIVIMPILQRKQRLREGQISDLRLHT